MQTGTGFWRSQITGDWLVAGARVGERRGGIPVWNSWIWGGRVGEGGWSLVLGGGDET